MKKRTHGDIVVVDLGGTNIRLGYIRGGIPATQFQTISSNTLRAADACTVLLHTIQQFVSSHELKLTAAVLGLPGMLSKSTDELSHCNNIPQLEGKGLRAFLSKSLGCQVILEQDIMLQLLGEWKCGAAQASLSVYGVYFGTGIGAAYLVNGDPDAHGAAGLQAGHIPIMAAGKLCVCGNTDCIEAYACGHTLINLAATYKCTVKQLFTINSNPELSKELDRFLLYQSYMLATVITLINPDIILVGGGIPRMQGYPCDKLISNVRNHLQKPYPADHVKIKWASLGSNSFLYGALALLNLNKP